MGLSWGAPEFSRRPQTYTPPTFANEKAFQAHVLQLARAKGWMVYHPFDSRRSTPGYPDLTLVHPRHGDVLWIELKMPKGRISKAQRQWLDALQLRPNHRVHVFRPDDWKDLVAALDQQGV